MNDTYMSFRNHPFIAGIAETKKWTVSTNTKMPIDMYMFMYRGALCGAIYNNELSLVSLDTLHQVIPDAVNYAFYLDALTDHFVVLDIEPKCPDDIKEKLKSMPCLYCETSMSGRGIHMIFRLPEDILDQYPEARQKIVFKEEHGYYEILLNHYVTFTANQLPANISNDDIQFRELFQSMAMNQKITVKADIEAEILEKVETEHSDMILNTLMNHKGTYTKTLADFNGDRSKYEFGYIAFMNHKLGNMLNLKDIMKEHVYTDSERAWFLYQVASDYLPKRAKHEEYRNGMPWLLYLAFEVIAKNKADEEKQKDKKKKGK